MVKNQYMLGVDGGNTKTHYFLYDDNGYVGHIKAGTCSHEQFLNGYEGTRQELSARIGDLTKAHGITVSDITAAVFGLAGADFDIQKKELSDIVASLGFRNFVIDNDGYLGLKAGSFSGVGVCSVNGTGTITVGVNSEGKRVQIGGVGSIVSDRAGGVYIADCALEHVYNELYRCGAKTALTDFVLKHFQITDKSMFLEKTVLEPVPKSVKHLITKEVFKLEKSGDAIAIRIMREVGRCLGRSAAGCVRELAFNDEVSIVLSGSVWTRGNSDNMQNAFINEFGACYGRAELNIIKLTVPPAVGAVLWAYELAGRQLGIDGKLKITEDIVLKKIAD